MKKFICVLLSIILILTCFTGCDLKFSSKKEINDDPVIVNPGEELDITHNIAIGEGSLQDYHLKAMVIGYKTDSPNAFVYLSQPMLLGFSVSKIDISKEKTSQLADRLKNFDIVYLDESIKDINDDKLFFKTIESFAHEGGAVFAPNCLFDKFDENFFGAKGFEKLSGYPSSAEKTNLKADLLELAEIVTDFKSIYEQFDNADLLKAQDYGYYMYPDKAVSLVNSGSGSLYAMNKYGEGLVFFVNSLLPNFYSNGNFNMSNDESLTGFSNATLSFNMLVYNGFARYVAKFKYGYALEKVYGYYGAPNMSWELHYEEIEGIKNNTLISFSELLKEYKQIPSFSIIKDSYRWFLRTEGISYLLNKSKQGYEFDFDWAEGVYSSGTHIDAGGKFLEQIQEIDETSYFAEEQLHDNRAYADYVLNSEGAYDIYSGSKDGRIYFYKGIGYGDRYKVYEGQVLQNGLGEDLFVPGFSAPALADVNGDGRIDIVSGCSDGKLYVAYANEFGFEQFASYANFNYLNEPIEGQTLPRFADMNNDSVIDLILGSNTGYLKIYYGEKGEKGVSFFAENCLDLQTLASDCELGLWLSANAVDWNNDGLLDLLVGTYDGYVFLFSADKNKDRPFEPVGFLRGQETTYKGNFNLKFGNYASPSIIDLNGDGSGDLICGNMEYGLPYSIDDPLYPAHDELQAQIDYAKENNIYLGVHFFTQEFSSAEKEESELKRQKQALESYGIDLSRVGTNQHTWWTSSVSDTQSFESAWNVGLLWNSGFSAPGYFETNPQYAKENTVTFPFFLINENGEETILMQNTSIMNYVPYEECSLSAKYEMPLLQFYHCDYSFQSDEGARGFASNLANFKNENQYNFVKEDQLMLANAAVIHQTVNAEGGLFTLKGIKLVSAQNKTDYALYDETVASSLGCKISLSGDFSAKDFSVDADVWYIKGNNIYVGLNREATITFNPGNNAISHIERINGAAVITKELNGINTINIAFKEGGLMELVVLGTATTTDIGWDVVSENGVTTFTKYGEASDIDIRISL